MLNAMIDNNAAVLADQTRHAYNAAFEELGLTWHWDGPTYARLECDSRGAVRVYLETEQSHLLRAYEADFLVEAVEAAKARCQASMLASTERPAPYLCWSSGSAPSARTSANTTPAPRYTPTALRT